ncbi:MAG: phosphatidylglycerophosphatase A [Elusimicrobiota bacterium]
MSTLWRCLASLFFLGYFPFAPGSLATLFAAVCWWFLPSSLTFTFFLLPLSTLFSVLITQQAENSFGQKDDQRIVLDEFVGFLWTMAFLPKKLSLVIIGIILFRIFDIGKRPLIHKLQRCPGGWGIVADDILAGIFANIILQIMKFCFK